MAGTDLWEIQSKGKCEKSMDLSFIEERNRRKNPGRFLKWR